jgi:hypothetical protein
VYSKKHKVVIATTVAADLLIDELSDSNVGDGSGVVSQQVNVRINDVHVAIVTKGFY